MNAVGNGRAGSVAATTAVSGDPTIRTWRAFGVEGRHATVDFPVQLHPAASSTVTVDYRTEDNTATAPADYRATNGTLTFARGETEKTVSVPIVDDTVEDSGEWFWLRLSNVSGALLGDEYAGGWIYNHEDVVAGFTLVDAASGTDVGSLVDGTEVTLADPANGQYGVRVETLPEAAIGSLRLKLSGAKAVTRTDNVAPYTLYSAGGEGLPPGAYTLQATAYPAAEGEAGEAPALQTLSVSFTVTAAEAESEEPAPLTASFENMPVAHDGSSRFSFRVAFSEDIGISYVTMRDDAFEVDEGDVTGARRVDGRHDLWEITVEPDSREAVTITLNGGRDCGTTGAVCTRGDDPRPLSSSPSATVAGPDDDPAVTNTVATGAPTISGTAQVNETLTASVSDISDADGLDNASFAYQWIRGSADIEGATDSSYTLVSADEGETMKVRVTFTDDADNAESVTSGASDPVEAAPEPLTATFTDVPSEHRGEGETFTFGLTFSEEFGLSYKTLRDEAFSASGGEVRRAKRKQQGSNQSWTIHVEPSGHGPLTVTLPETTDCGATGAICTDDDRPLSHSLSATVAGPVGISVGDARVEEDDGAVLSFAVTLSRTTGADVSVDYETSDGTAEAGADYTATSGTLTIGAGSRSASIDVPVLDDAHDDDDETLTLTLSNPTNAVLDDATATGTIDNNDAMPRALMARFGRTAAVHVIDQIEERIEAPRRPGFDGRIAGRNVDRNIGRDFALGFLRQLGGGAGYGGMSRGRQAMPGRASQATSATHLMQPHGAGRTGTGNAAPMGAGRPGAGAHQQNGMTGLGFSQGQVLTGSSFALNRGTKNGGVLSVWSRSAQSRFHGREGLLALNGDVVTSTVGADYAKGRMVSGVAVAHSRGTGGYSGEHRGAVSSAITGVYPWIGYEASERISVWTVAGYGGGGLLLSPEAGSPIETGLSMAMAAGGGRGRIAGSERGFSLAFKADALWVGTRSEQAHTAGGRLNGTTATVTRLRTALEGAKNVALSKRMGLRTTVEIGIRQDGGDAETGRGMDLGAGLVLADGVTGLAVDIRVRRLLVHQAEGFAESGMSISVSYNPTPSTPLGFTARVSPAWGGDAMSGAEALWGRESMAGMGNDPLMNGGGQRLDTEVGYGLPIGSRFVGTPRAGVRTSEYGRDYRIGYGMQVLEQGRLNLQLGVDAERRESPIFHLQEQSRSTDQRVLGRATVQW